MNNASPLTVLVAGGTGLVGRYALAQLLDKPDIGRVVSLVRTPVAKPHPKLTEVTVDFDRLVLPLGVKADAAICALGTTMRAAGSQDAFRRVDHSYVLSFAKAARAAGVTRFAVVSSVGASSTSPNFYLRTKGMMEDYVLSLGFPSFQVMRPSLLLGQRLDGQPPRKLEDLAQLFAPYIAPFLIGRLTRYRPIKASLVGAALAQAVRLPPFAGHRVHEYQAIRALAEAGVGS